MKAELWTTNGRDIWRLRRKFDFKNLDTGEVVTCDCVSEVTAKNFQPVQMPEIEQKSSPPKTTESSRPRSKYKGVNLLKKTSRWRASFWDKILGKTEYLGTFDSELLAAAAYQEHIGNKKEAQRLLNEHQEGNCGLEVWVNPAERPSEE